MGYDKNFSVMAANVVATLFTSGNILAGLLFALAFILYWRVFMRDDRRLNSPPGPKGWPLVGNLLSLGFHSERDMMEFNGKYGPVCKLKMASQPFVLLGSMEAVNEAFVKKGHIFSDRIKNSINGLSGDGGILFVQNGKLLKEQKRFCISTLKDFGMGRRSIELGILELCSELNQDIDSYCEKNEPFEIGIMLYMAISGVISKLVFGKDLAKESKGFNDYLHRLARGNKRAVLGTIILFFPKLKAVPPFRFLAHDSRVREESLAQLLQEEIDDHKRTRDHKHPRDLIDCFLNEMDKLLVGEEETGFNEKQLKSVVRDLFLAGSETSASTLRWALLYLCKNLDVQERLHKEIDEVLGHSKPPSTSLMDQMPYTRAVIQETMRIRPLAPIGIPHCARTGGNIMGYDIAKGTLVVANIFGIHHDEKIWPNPDKFDPTRHLDSSGKFEKSQNIIPFSIGPRQCLGILLANMELFLFLVSMLQKFSFSLADGQNIDMRGRNAVVLQPYPFKLIAKRR